MKEIVASTTDNQGGTPMLFPDEPLKQKLIRNGFWLYFFSFIVAPTGYIIKVIASRQLSVEDIGIFYSILGVISLISTYNDLGLTEALQYFLPHYFIDKDYQKAKSMLSFALISQFISSAIIIAVLLFIAPWLAANYFQSPLALPLLQLFCIYFLVINTFQMIQSLFIATQQVKRSQGIEGIRMRTIVIFAILAWQLDIFSLNVFMLCRLGGLVASTIVGIIAMRKQFGWLNQYKATYDKKIIKQWFSYALWVIIGTNATILLTQIDQQFALYFFGAEGAGYWTNYLTLFNLISIICTPLIGYLFPLLNELQKKKEREKIRLLNRILYAGFFAVGIALGVVAFFWGPEIAVLLFGEKFRISGELFAAGAWFLWLVPIMGIQFQNLASHGMVKQRVWILASGVFVNATATVILVPDYGLKGIIYGMVAGQAAAIGLSMLELYLHRKRQHLNDQSAI